MLTNLARRSMGFSGRHASAEWSMFRPAVAASQCKKVQCFAYSTRPGGFIGMNARHAPLVAVTRASPEVQPESLSHMPSALLADMEAFLVKRYWDFDEMRLDDYVKGCDEHIRVEVFVKGESVVACDGYAAYYKMFSDTIDTFRTRQIVGVHTTRAVYFRVNGDGSVSSHMDYDFYEYPIGKPNEQVWVNSGMYKYTMKAASPGSFDIKDWNMTDYRVDVMLTPEGSTSDGGPLSELKGKVLGRILCP
ncbi:unnamed protein product [Polarella glacialis]|uniref:Uncharacterized protein n=1 Tax=Polarella glacialis TaxID=89957 RepID=A0A813LV51_POLGL|nr:unnamed protein product [Polarella glacialis]